RPWRDDEATTIARVGTSVYHGPGLLACGETEWGGANALCQLPADAGRPLTCLTLPGDPDNGTVCSTGLFGVRLQPPRARAGTAGMVEGRFRCAAEAGAPGSP